MLRFVGDRIRLELSHGSVSSKLSAFVRTTLGNDARLRQRSMAPITGDRFIPGAEWRNVPMEKSGRRRWVVEFTLTEPGFFWAKGYFRDVDGMTHWPDGDNLGITVHPAALRAGNTIYCAFTRLFGDTRTKSDTVDTLRDAHCRAFDEHGYTVIPPSGTFRNLVAQLPHIVETLGCRILHLLPVNPTPTTMARMGRFGSPYATLDLTAIDPALVDFDRRTTGIDQFCELTRATHHLGGRVMLDLVINHTGWGSKLFEHHPNWFVRSEDGTFKSPGAWGVTWGDLVELDQRHVDLWAHIAQAFVTWCRRGVDGFRCDAGYMIPPAVWQAITARVREEFPETIFFLEGLGGPFSATEQLLTEGGMQWAYSELFQNWSKEDVATYNDHSIAQNERLGLLVHFSETHDNDRLAAKGRTWSLLRNRLCALASHSGGFGFMCGVEWLNREKVNVHKATGLGFDNDDNIVAELATLNHLLQTHPCFYDHAVCRRLSEIDDPVYLLERTHPEYEKRGNYLLVVANIDVDTDQSVMIPDGAVTRLGTSPVDLLGQEMPPRTVFADGQWRLDLKRGDVFCLSPRPFKQSANRRAYLALRKQHGAAVTALAHRFMPEQIGAAPWRELTALWADNPVAYLGAVTRVSPDELALNPVRALGDEMSRAAYDPILVWDVTDCSRLVPVPVGHGLLIRHAYPFRASFFTSKTRRNIASVPAARGHVSFIPAGTLSGDARLELDSVDLEGFATGHVRFLDGTPRVAISDGVEGRVLLTNGRGGMARCNLDLNRIDSRYDGLLSINEHSRWPVDRTLLCKGLRAWLVTDGFSQQLEPVLLDRVEVGNQVILHYRIGACNGVVIPLKMEICMIPQRNCTVVRFERGGIEFFDEETIKNDSHMNLIVRVDLEDRTVHEASHYSLAKRRKLEQHLSINDDSRGFTLQRPKDRSLHVFCRQGAFVFEPEWRTDIPHPLDAQRGEWPSGTAYSPGWFLVDLRRNVTCTLVMDTDAYSEGNQQPLTEAEMETAFRALAQSAPITNDTFSQALTVAIDDFVVKRDDGKTVIAGYPWFLDWGRDTLICARGLLSARRHGEVRDILRVFGRFVRNGTLPNCIHGDNQSNRDTSDAPLWYGVVVEDIVALEGDDFYATPVTAKTSIADVLADIGIGYASGTPNGIRLDADSGLIWSPAHFSWMDTNYPAGTPREGYPIEIQALWLRLLRQLHRLRIPYKKDVGSWADLAARATTSLKRYYWDSQRGYLADTINAKSGIGAADGIVDTALRCNCLFAISLGQVDGRIARDTVRAVQKHLVVPGGIRSLAPLPLEVPLPIHGAEGQLLNDPDTPYVGIYQGDENTRRKPAYHNGTVWTWLFPVFCEALYRAWGSSAARKAAIGYLAGMDYLLTEGCLGHVPEILDGDFPHTQRGCDAQAWSVTEALRVWNLLHKN